MSADVERAEADAVEAAAEVAGRLLANVERVVLGKRRDRARPRRARCGGTCCSRTCPGTAKTVLARASRARSRAPHRRGSSARPTCSRPTSRGSRSTTSGARFEFRPGPVFANIVLVDEINRAMPKRSRRCSRRWRSGRSRSTAVAPAARPVPRPRDREPARARGHVPAARGPARPLLPQDGARLPRRDEELEIVQAQRHGHPLDRLEPVSSRRPRGAPRRRRGRLHRPAPPALGHRPRSRDARACRAGCRAPRSAARWRSSGPPAPGAAPRARLRRAGDVERLVRASALAPPAPLAPRRPSRWTQPTAARAVRERCLARAPRPGRRRATRGHDPSGARLPADPCARLRAHVRRAARAAGGAPATRSRARARTAGRPVRRSTGTRRRGSRRRAEATSSSSATTSPTRRRGSSSSSTGARRWRSTRRAALARRGGKRSPRRALRAPFARERLRLGDGSPGSRGPRAQPALGAARG